MKEDKKQWRNIAKWWAATGVIERYKPKLFSDEMKAYCTGLIQGFIIGAITGALLILVLTKLGG